MITIGPPMCTEWARAALATHASTSLASTQRRRLAFIQHSETERSSRIDEMLASCRRATGLICRRQSHAGEATGTRWREWRVTTRDLSRLHRPRKNTKMETKLFLLFSPQKYVWANRKQVIEHSTREPNSAKRLFIYLWFWIFLWYRNVRSHRNLWYSLDCKTYVAGQCLFRAVRSRSSMMMVAILRNIANELISLFCRRIFSISRCGIDEGKVTLVAISSSNFN